MSSLLAIVFAFILTTLVGGYIAQAWQRRAWHLQQRFLGHEKEYNNLRELIDEMLSMLGARIYHMKRIVLSTGLEDAKFTARLSEYDDITKKWNERLASFHSRLTILATYNDSLSLERIQKALVSAAGLIDSMIKDQKGKAPKDIHKVRAAMKSLDLLQGRLSYFSKSLLNGVEKKRFEVYYGRYVPYNRYNIRFFSTWQLVKGNCSPPPW
jgi:hypothetical protein